MNNHAIAVPAVYALLFKDDKILLMQRCNTGYEDGKWSIPSGHLLEGELPKFAIQREVLEEVTVMVPINELKIVHVSFRPKHDHTGARVDYFYKGHKWIGDVTNGEPKKCSRLIWVKPNDLPKDTTPVVQYAISAFLKGQLHSELSLSWIKDHGLYKL